MSIRLTFNLLLLLFVITLAEIKNLKMSKRLLTALEYPNAQSVNLSGNR